MSNDDIYFKWLINQVYNKSSVSYDKLFRKLYDTEFIFVIKLDENRLVDAIHMREQFGDIQRDISVLEVLIALAKRVDEDIMRDDNYGIRSGRWFWEMIFNMGLGQMTDDEFDENYVDDILRKFLFRTYDANGLGCAFRSKTHPDMRNVELWYQMNYWLNDGDI